MPILRNHHCGHVQRFCPRCLTTGCGNSRCSESIGKNSSMVCKNCGYTGVISMEKHQTTLKARAREAKRQEDETQTRLRNLEQATKTRYVGAGYSGPSYSGGGGSIPIFKIIIFLAVCTGLSTVLKFDEVDGILAIPVGFINLVAGLVAITIKLLMKLIVAIG
jgi:hypothetical protein